MLFRRGTGWSQASSELPVFADVSEKSLGAIFDQVGHQFESFITSVVGIRHFVVAVTRTELGEFPDFLPVPVGLGQLEHVGVVFVIHGQDEIEVMEVADVELSGRSGHLIASLFQGSRHPGVRFLPDVKPDRACRIALDRAGELFVFQEMPEDVLPGRRATDVPHADKEDLDGRHGPSEQGGPCFGKEQGVKDAAAGI